MVNNIAANVLGATPELDGGAESEGTDLSSSLTFRSDCHPVILHFHIFFYLSLVLSNAYEIKLKISLASF